MIKARAFSVLFCVWAATATAQSLDLSITDPDAIAAECGGTAAQGEILFETCSACHALDPADGLTTGPHLQSLFGRTVASVEGYDYSAGLRLMNAAGTIWERETLHAFLEDAAASPGHPVMDDEQARRDLLTYLRTATLPPPPLPGEMIIPEEVFAIEGDVPYGEYLGAECAGCHQDGAGSIPSIKGMDPRYFITAMHEYRARARENQTMRNVAARLDNEEIAALAAYFKDAE